VRGPLTANILKIDPALAITDGAALLRYFDFPRQVKNIPIHLFHMLAVKIFLIGRCYVRKQTSTS